MTVEVVLDVGACGAILGPGNQYSDRNSMRADQYKLKRYSVLTKTDHLIFAFSLIVVINLLNR